MEIDLKAIEARANAATPGPWMPDATYGSITAPNGADPRGDAEYYGAQLVAESCAKADQAFIANAREDVPALLSALRAAEQRALRWQALCEGRVLAGVQTLLVAASGGPWSSDMTIAEVLADIEGAIIAAGGPEGPPPTPAEVAEAARAREEAQS